MRHTTIFGALLFSLNFMGQSLDLMEYETLLTLYDESYDNSISQEKIARNYLKKAIRSTDIIKIERDDDQYAGVARYPINATYADSIIHMELNRIYCDYYFDLILYYLLKVDSISKVERVLPYRLIKYDTLYKFFESNNEFIKANSIMKKKTSIDSLFQENIKEMNFSNFEKVLKPNEIQSKNEKINSLESSRKKSKILINSLFISILVIISATFYYYKRQRSYAKRFFDLQKLQLESKPTKPVNEIIISDVLVTDILQKLQQFELAKGFLEKEISLQKLAKEFKTNANYLSRVVNLKIGKGFSMYINDLRTEYALQILQKDSKYLNYTIKAIAEECGYKGADSFSRAFYRKTGIYPSFYIKKLVADN